MGVSIDCARTTSQYVENATSTTDGMMSAQDKALLNALGAAAIPPVFVPAAADVTITAPATGPAVLVSASFDAKGFRTRVTARGVVTAAAGANTAFFQIWLRKNGVVVPSQQGFISVYIDPNLGTTDGEVWFVFDAVFPASSGATTYDVQITGDGVSNMLMRAATSPNVEGASIICEAVP